MPATISLTESQAMTALRGLLLAVLPSMQVVQAQVNRVSEPAELNFVDFNSVLRERLSTNVVDAIDTLFAGSIAGSTMNVTAVEYGTLQLGRQVFGTDVQDGTVIAAFGTGAGGTGTYILNVTNSLSPRPLAAGLVTMAQDTQLNVQIDVHGPDSADNAQIISTILRDALAVDLLQASGFDVAPLYAEAPRQLPYQNAEHQIENRWIVNAALECIPVVSWPQQFADVLRQGLFNVDVEFPPA